MKEVLKLKITISDTQEYIHWLKMSEAKLISKIAKEAKHVLVESVDVDADLYKTLFG